MTDDRLREAFRDLSREESAHVPPFEHLWRTAAPGCPDSGGPLSSTRTMALTLLILIVIALAIVPALHRKETPSITEWRAPTDFLLKTPGQELLSSVPDLKGTTQ
jgi:hypothetical protein